MVELFLFPATCDRNVHWKFSVLLTLKNINDTGDYHILILQQNSPGIHWSLVPLSVEVKKEYASLLIIWFWLCYLLSL